MNQGRKFNILLLAFLVNCSYLFSQNTNAYPFIQYHQNRLQLPSDSSNFIKLFKLLQNFSSDSGQSIQFIHFGDSHIQADIISNQFRNRISDLFCLDTNSVTQNYIFPHKVAKTNSNPTYKIVSTGNWEFLKNTVRQDSSTHTLPLGISGMSITPKDSINKLLTILNPQQKRGNQLYMFYSPQKKITSPIYLGKDSLLYNKHFPAQGYSLFEFRQISDSIHFHFSADSFSMQLQGMYIPPTQKQVSVNSAGVNGAKIGSLKRCEQLKSQMQIIAPQCVILSYGTNDAYKKFEKEIFINDYESIISTLQECNPNICIILTTPAHFFRNKTQKVQELPELVNCIYEIAEKKQCAVWDLYQIAGGNNAIQKWFAQGLANKDKIHFSNKGYRLQGDLLFEAFYQSYLEHKN